MKARMCHVAGKTFLRFLQCRVAGWVVGWVEWMLQLVGAGWVFHDHDDDDANVVLMVVVVMATVTVMVMVAKVWLEAVGRQFGDAFQYTQSHDAF